jgi:hypothetical protein
MVYQSSHMDLSYRIKLKQTCGILCRPTCGDWDPHLQSNQTEPNLKERGRREESRGIRGGGAYPWPCLQALESNKSSSPRAQLVGAGILVRLLLWNRTNLKLLRLDADGRGELKEEGRIRHWSRRGRGAPAMPPPSSSRTRPPCSSRTGGCKMHRPVPDPGPPCLFAGRTSIRGHHGRVGSYREATKRHC